MIEIKKVQGYTIYYEPTNGFFYLYNPRGDEEDRAEKQGVLEERVKKLIKQEFKRIPILRIYNDGEVINGEITSYNFEYHEMWVNMEKSGQMFRGGRQKVSLRYRGGTGFYEPTEHNLKIAAEMKLKTNQITKIRGEVEKLYQRLEKEITSAFFEPDKGDKQDDQK